MAVGVPDSNIPGKDAIKPWWFAVSKEDPKEVTVCFNDSPDCGSNEGGSPCNVTKVEEEKPRHIKIHFSDETTRVLPVQGFAEGKGDFKHSLNASMKSQQFVEQFQKDLDSQKKKKGSSMKTAAMIGAVVGAPLAVGGVLVALPAIGFTSAGIAAGSMAASMMSSAAVASGGGVAAGSAVAVLQSVGAAGLGAAGTAAVGSAGAGVGAAVSGLASKIFGK